MGHGGGQILRSALGLSSVTGRAIHLTHIRSRRKRPGLLRQHLAGVRAAAALTQAEVYGDELGSSALSFAPQAIRAGTYDFSVGSAGSTLLVLQAILPALLVTPKDFQIHLKGGTHNPSAPPLSFFEGALAPLLRHLGHEVRIHEHRAGFFPAGGGSITVHFRAATEAKPLCLLERGEAKDHRGIALLAKIPPSVGLRETQRLSENLSWPSEWTETREIRSPGPGNVLLAELHFTGLSEVFTAFGRRGKKAEKVADELSQAVRKYLASQAPVGPHLADQLMIPLALGAGGQYLTQELTGHGQSQIEILRLFLGLEVKIQPLGSGVKVTVPPWLR